MKKNFYESKAVWGGILVAVGGVAVALGHLLQGDIDLNIFLTQVAPLIGNGLGIIGIRFAME